MKCANSCWQNEKILATIVIELTGWKVERIGWKHQVIDWKEREEIEWMNMQL